MLELSFQCKYGRRQEATTTYNEFTEKKTLENWLPWNQLTKTMLCIVFFFSFAVLLTGYILWILNSSSLLCCHPIWHTHKYEDKPTKKNGVWSILFAHFLIFFFFHFSTFFALQIDDAVLSSTDTKAFQKQEYVKCHFFLHTVPNNFL